MSGKLYCITGPSGSGKTSIARELFARECMSVTTRPMRDGEVDGEDYQFITKEEFLNLQKDGQLMEVAEYDGHFYGLTAQELAKQTRLGDAFFVCTFEGFAQIREKYDNICSVFLYASEEDCYNNMLDRGDSPEKAHQRMKSYDDFIKHRGEYDYVIKNIRGLMGSSILILHRIRNGESFPPTRRVTI